MSKERKNKLKNTLSMVRWGVLIFIITRQVPFVSYSILGNLAYARYRCIKYALSMQPDFIVHFCLSSVGALF